MNGRLLTARELGQALGLKAGTILDRWERGELPGYKFGRAVRFDLDEVLAVGRRPGARGEVPTAPPRRPTGNVFSLSPTAPDEGEDDA